MALTTAARTQLAAVPAARAEPGDKDEAAVVGAVVAGAGGWWWLKAPADGAEIASVQLGPGPAAMGVSLQWAVP